MEIFENYNLQEVSYWKIGGTAKIYIKVYNVEDYCKAIVLAEQKDVLPIVIGNTSNLLFDNGVLNIAVIQLGGDFLDIKVSGNVISVGSAVSSQKLVRFGHENSLSGLEHIIGIPATVGGLIYMNGGSNRKTVSERVTSVESVDVKGNLFVRHGEDCQFSYRKSIFQEKKELICRASFELIHTSDIKERRRECLSILSSRRAKFPSKLPSCGSVFISYPDLYKSYGPPGKVIEDLGLKGLKVGGAEISPVHANFIVNNGNARASDVLELVKIVNSQVEEKLGCTLESEAIFIGRDGDVKQLHNAL